MLHTINQFCSCVHKARPKMAPEIVCLGIAAHISKFYQSLIMDWQDWEESVDSGWSSFNHPTNAL